ncbi:MAG: hypothetical protein ABIP75_13495 [Pyrinomonadaceae bacterium]
MENSTSNGPLVAMTFIVGLGAVSFTGVLTSVVVAILMGVLGKAVDVALRVYIARRECHWRREARRLDQELRRLSPTGKRPDPDAIQRKQPHAGNP